MLDYGNCRNGPERFIGKGRLQKIPLAVVNPVSKRHPGNVGIQIETNDVLITETTKNRWDLRCVSADIEHRHTFRHVAFDEFDRPEDIPTLENIANSDAAQLAIA